MTRSSRVMAARRARATALNWARRCGGGRDQRDPDVQAQDGVVGERLEDVAGHGAGEMAADEDVLLAFRLALVDHVGSAGDVDDGVDQGLVERDGRIAEA